MNAKIEALLKKRDDCLEFASCAGFEAARRDQLVRLARSYELDVILIEKTLRYIAESKELMFAVDSLLKTRATLERQ